MKNFKIARIQTSSSGSMRYVASHSFAYNDEPLAEPGQNTDINPEDPDGLLPATLQQRSDGRVDLKPMVSIFIVLHTYLCCEIFITDVSRLDKNILLCNARQLLCFLVNLTSDNYMVLLFKLMQYFFTVFFI